MDQIHGLVNSAKDFIYRNQPFKRVADISSFAHEQILKKMKKEPSPPQDGLTHLSPLDENTYPENPKFDTRFNGGTISMTIRPVTGLERLATWQAEMEFYVKDMDSLMLNGLHWSEANVEVAGGCILVPSDDMPNLPRSLGWLFGRRYLLKDLGDDPKWRATLWFYGRDCDELSRMKLDDLSVELVRRAKAIAPGLGEVYKFDLAQESGYNSNELYGDRPLEGWWPWPKEKQVKPLGFNSEAVAE